MGGTLTYDKVQYGKKDNVKILAGGGEFPVCKGFYPDCPDNPSLLGSKCRNCPKTESIKKPKLEWIGCEHCEKEEVVPFDTDSPIDKNEDTKCHSCRKINSAEWIKKQRKK